MFGLLGDAIKGVANIAGSIVGSVVGLSATVVASTLGITLEAVNEALDAGCTTYEDIRDFHKL